MPHPFPPIHPIPSPATDLQKDAQLALSLLLFFESTQDRYEGMWRDSGPSSTLRLTCHVLEALFLLHQDAMRSPIENGLTWLINLSDGLENNGQAHEDLKAVCGHPSRFKTLIWLQGFGDRDIQSEFFALNKNLDSDGLLHDTSLDSILATMIYFDCLLLLPASKLANDLAQDRTRIAALLESRLESGLTEGQLSYAIDLLIRAGRSKPDWVIAQGLHSRLIRFVSAHQQDRPLDSDVLYCAIHLATHFGDNEGARSVVKGLLAQIRQKYYRNDLRRESSSFHPLVMRLLVSFHGPFLEPAVLSLLLRREKTLQDQGIASEENRRLDAFQQVIKKRIQVGIQEEMALTGGITKAEVFRVKFQINLKGIGEEGSTGSTRIAGDFNSLVIKVSTLDLLISAIEHYHRLPSAVKPYFATHSGPIGPLADSQDGLSYLVLEDLTERYETFRSIVDLYDRRSLSTDHRSKLYQACTIVLKQLFEIYDYTREPANVYTGYQLYRLYLGRLERALIEGAQTHTHLKTWYQGFWLNESIPFPAMEYYHGKLDRFKARLKVPFLSLIHGDCHTRNIMVDDCYEHIKLIDLDRTVESGDYIQDIALLVEDIAIFRFLFDEDYPYHLEPEDVAFPSKDPTGIENKINYQPITSRTVVDIQHHILGIVEEYARQIEDHNWRERLWLALAVHLLRLVEKHENPKLASVLYVEAIKLLDTLDRALESGIPPMGIPFPGTHAITEEAAGEPALWPTLPAQEQEYLRTIHRRTIGSEKTIRYDVNRTGTAVKYFIDGVEHPVLVIYGDRSPIQMLMAADPTILDDPKRLTAQKTSRGALRTVLNLADQPDIDAVVDLVMQTLGGLGSDEPPLDPLIQ